MKTTEELLNEIKANESLRNDFSKAANENKMGEFFSRHGVELASKSALKLSDDEASEITGCVSGEYGPRPQCITCLCGGSAHFLQDDAETRSLYICPRCLSIVYVTVHPDGSYTVTGKHGVPGIM